MLKNIKKPEVSDDKHPVIAKDVDGAKLPSHAKEDKKPEVSDDKYPVIVEGVDGAKLPSPTKEDRKPEVSDGKYPVIVEGVDGAKLSSPTKEDKKPKVSDDKHPVSSHAKEDKKPGVGGNNHPVIAKDVDGAKLSSPTKEGKKPKVSDDKHPVSSHAKEDKKPGVGGNNHPVIAKGVDETELSKAIREGEKSEVGNDKVPVENVGSDHYGDKELVGERGDNGLHLLLKFPKDNDKQRGVNGVNDDANNSPLLGRGSNDGQLQRHGSEVDNQQKHSHKAVHFLSFLKKTEDAERQLQEMEHGNSQDNNDCLDSADSSLGAEMEDEMQDLIDRGDGNESVKISQEESDTSVNSVEQAQITKNPDEEEDDYTLTYYYDDENIAVLER
ncbi:MAG: hypothetical protein ACTJLM_00125 [Ehrlichia sp.]